MPTIETLIADITLTPVGWIIVGAIIFVAVVCFIAGPDDDNGDEND